MPKASSFVLATDREVQNAKPKGARAEFRIKGAQNLVLRVSATGTKKWAFLYSRPTSGRRCKLSLGAYPAIALTKAKQEALALTVAVLAGKDPLHQRREERAADTFEKLALRYLAEHERKYARGAKKSAATIEAERVLKVDILPTIGSYRAEAVTKRHVMDVVQKVADRGAFVAADRVLTIIRAVYNWAISTGRLDVNPTLGLKKRNASGPRERVLDDDEIRVLWRRLDTPSKLSQEIRNALKLQLLLGVRIGEALGAAKSEIDLSRRVWSIPAFRTKSGREHRLPLPALAVSILQSANDRAGASRWLFPSPKDDGRIRSHSASTAMRRLRIDIGLGDVGTHDLRRTLATGLGNMGVPDEVIERVLNHAPRTVAGRHYNHAKHFEPMRRALDAWAERLLAIIDNHSNVVVLRARTKSE